MSGDPGGAAARPGPPVPPWTLRVAAGIVVALLALRWLVAPARAGAGLVGAGVDAALLGGLALAAAGRPRGPLGAMGRRLLLATGAAYAAIAFWHAFFFDIGAEYQYSLASVSYGTALFFVRELVPGRGWVAFAGFGLLLAASGRWLPVPRALARVGEWSAARRRAGSLALLGLGIGLAALPAVEHPVSSLLRDGARWLAGGAAAAAGDALPTGHLRLLRDGTWPVASRYRRVLVFVMEGVPRHEFDSVVATLPPGRGFFRAVEGIAAKYEGLYTTNQESRTARMAMMHSLLIPHEAYVEDWRSVFGWVYARGGMVELLAANGWKTAVAIPLVEVPWDLRYLPWGETLSLEGGIPAGSGMTCLAPTQFDRGCEDRILLDRVAALLDGPGPLFLFQPFLFGHTSKWEETAGIHRVVYYDRYLTELYERLRRRNLAGETLIVVTADHGPRTYEGLRQLGSYEVPLWLIDPSFDGETRRGFFSNAEFRDLLLGAMQNGAPPPAPSRPFVMAMGPTARGLFLCAWPGGGHALLRIRAEGLASVVQAVPDSVDARSCVGTFFQYRREFDATR